MVQTDGHFDPTRLGIGAPVPRYEIWYPRAPFLDAR